MDNETARMILHSVIASVIISIIGHATKREQETVASAALFAAALLLRCFRGFSVRCRC
jgi:hypothetical protein